MQKRSYKYYPTGEAVLDIRTSCTREEAAAKLIGWMKGHVRHAYPHDVDQDELTAEHFIYTQSLVYPLGEQLQILRQAAGHRYDKAVCDNLSSEILEDLATAIHEYDDLINQVQVYLSDIDDELDKEFEQVGSSALKIDKRTTDSSGELHIKIRSLDRWAHDKYGISIMDPDGMLDLYSVPSPVAPASAPAAPVSAPVPVASSTAAKESSDLIVDNLSDTDIECTDKGVVLKPKEAKNLYLTFMFLVEAVAASGSKYRLADKSPNISVIATLIEEFAIKAHHPLKHKSFSGETIKTRIENAETIKREYL